MRARALRFMFLFRRSHVSHPFRPTASLTPSSVLKFKICLKLDILRPVGGKIDRVVVLFNPVATCF